MPKNQGNTDGFPISDVILTHDQGIDTTNTLAESTVELETLPNAQDNTIYTSPSQKRLERLIEEEALLEDGYDSDGKIGSSSDAIILEGKQDFLTRTNLALTTTATATVLALVAQLNQRRRSLYTRKV